LADPAFLLVQQTVLLAFVICDCDVKPVVCADREKAGFRSLTSQPFGPNLRHSRHIPLKVQHIRVLALLLAVVFLGAQFHYCVDLGSTLSGSHVCPLCSTAGVAVMPVSPGISVAPVANRLEVILVLADLSAEIPQAVSPRAPPAV